MPLVTAKEMLDTARREGYAVPAFNIENMEMAQACVAAAEKDRAPLIMQTTPGTLKYAPLPVFAGIVEKLAATSEIPIALHLDHGSSFDLAAQACHAGYTSIMFDGSQMPYNDNLRVSKAVVEMCHPMGIPVELELGTVGGKEDTLKSSGVAYTDPSQAVEFVSETKTDFLAVAIGTSHGIYKGTPVLDTGLLERIAAVVNLPLVLHGSSGLTDAQVMECVERGIAKVNFATELRAAYTRAVREFLSSNTNAIDPKKFGEAGRQAVYDGCRNRISILGCAGRA